MQITVNASKVYNIEIRSGILDNCGALIKSVAPASKACIITDSNVDKLYSKRVEDSLSSSGYAVNKFVFPAGESSKNISVYGEILSFLAKTSTMRDEVLVALGGGVVGDMAGFVAATYMRGVKYVQIPTTLLAVIDSSVGGKTAVDLPEGKNLVGAFYQPEIVVADVDTFKTLPSEIFYDGMGELAKYALLVGDELERLIQDGVEKNIAEIVAGCVDYKRQVVEKDEFEHGDRKLLNLGHTLAHGIEKLSGYSISHGKAVGMGLALISKACLKNGLLSKSEYNRVVDLLKLTNQSLTSPYEIKDIYNASLVDKKRNSNGITVVTVHRMGDVRLTEMSLTELEEFLCK